jgi:hypothetical protein
MRARTPFGNSTVRLSMTLFSSKPGGRWSVARGDGRSGADAGGSEPGVQAAVQAVVSRMMSTIKCLRATGHSHVVETFTTVS